MIKKNDVRLVINLKYKIDVLDEESAKTNLTEYEEYYIFKGEKKYYQEYDSEISAYNRIRIDGSKNLLVNRYNYFLAYSTLYIILEECPFINQEEIKEKFEEFIKFNFEKFLKNTKKVIDQEYIAPNIKTVDIIDIDIIEQLQTQSDFENKNLK
jgi:hypothetical protein